ncbi:pyridoxal-dependent decarboxylase [Pantoea sp. At-9b]|uniref:pyridoxal-dependent decarboxylase n=1 Tax=Pantoea sp. (strain At-9b) TaxID=592316 RepID=UPI0001B3E154|nr:pyridoxal-dependent decarboxylase [Pantoea sp. At-9b]ADU71888.1 Pyridoxal-dependent decarboxylase [Pantoea sp. At-9b]
MEKIIDEKNEKILTSIAKRFKRDLPQNDYHIFETPDSDLTKKAHERIQKLYRNVLSRQTLSLGYPVNQKLDYSVISPFLNLHINNAGDPYDASSTLLNTRDLEQEVLDYFANLWHAIPRSPLTPESFWGYVLAMGSTEGNLYAMWSAREYFKGKVSSCEQSIQRSRNPVLYFSSESHYSIEKSASILGVDTFQQIGNAYFPGECPITEDGHWPHGVPVDEYGGVDPYLLELLVSFFANHGYPPIIVLNVGTTFQGAFDDVTLVWQRIAPILKQNGFCIETDCFSRPDFWIHIDGALGAAYLPYLEMAYQSELSHVKGGLFDFRLPWVNSIVMSTHKWFGSPFVSGIYMSKEKYRMAPATLPEYIDSPDTTLSGSRNGLSALMLWYAVFSVSSEKQAVIAARCEKVAAYAYECMHEIKKIHPEFRVIRGPQSLVVLFSRPCDEIFNRFQLSGRGELAHIVAMPHVTYSAIDCLVNALKESDMFS